MAKKSINPIATKKAHVILRQIFVLNEELKDLKYGGQEDRDAFCGYVCDNPGLFDELCNIIGLFARPRMDREKVIQSEKANLDALYTQWKSFHAEQDTAFVTKPSP